MSWFVPAFDLWLHVTLAGLAITAAASLAVLVIREPTRKIRVIQLTLAGLLALPALVLLPGYPRVAWWPAASEIEPISLLTKSPPVKQAAASAAPLPQYQPSSTTQSPDLLGGSSTATYANSAEPRTNQPSLDTTPPASAAPADLPPRTAPIAATPIPTAPSMRESTSTEPFPAARLAVAAPPKPARFEFPALPDYRLLVISAYLLGVAVFAVWWLVGRIALWRLLRTSAPAEPHVRALLDELIEQHAAGPDAARVRLLVSPRAAQPCAFGWWRPTIVLPQRVVNELTPDQLRLALSHEWSHVARGDIRTWMLAGLVRLVHFHQPLVWFLRRELRISQDYLADAAAAGSATPEDYAELLTTLSRMLRPTPLSPGLGIAPRQSELYRRVVMLVDQSRPLERTIPRRWNLAAIALGLALIAGVATLRAEPEAGEPAPVPAESSPVAVDPPGDSESRLGPSSTPAVPSLARPRTRQELLNDPADRRDVALQLVTVGRQLESLLKTRKSLQVRLASGEHNPQDQSKLEQILANIDDGIAEASQRFVEMQAHFDAASLKEHARSQAAVADWEPSGDKRRLLEASWAELDQLLKLRDQMFKQAAEQTNSKDREPLEIEVRRLDQKRFEITQRIEELLQPQATARPIASRPTPRAGTPAAQANGTLSATALAQEPRESRYASLNHDQIRTSRKQLVERAENLQSMRRQLAQTRENLEKLAEEQSRTDDGKTIQPELERLAAQDAQLAEELDECLAKIHEIPLIPGDKLELEITRKGKDPQTLQRTIPSDGNIVLASESGNIHYYVEGKTLSEVGGMINEQLKQLKTITDDDRLGISYAGHDERIASGGQPSDPPHAALISRKEPSNQRSAPFSGRIRPGDILGIELVGGFPTPLAPTRTVEPDGNLALGPIYGPASRVKVAGMTLIEAGQEIEKQLKAVLRDPKVMLTYEGHNDGVVAAGAPAEAASTQGKPAPATEPVVLQPLDTIEIIAPLAKPRIHIANHDGKPGEVFTGENPNLSGTYIIEPDGRVALPDAGGRVKLGGLTEAEASNALREHLAKSIFTRTALPTTRVLRRGRAVFDEGVHPAADYKIQPGDKLLLGTLQGGLFTSTVDKDGNLQGKVNVAGMTLEDAQAAAREKLIIDSSFGSSSNPPWLVTLGGWREEADPRVIDLIEGGGSTQLLRMQEEMQELKAMIRRLQAE